MAWKSKTKNAVDNIRLTWPGKEAAACAADVETNARLQKVESLSCGDERANLVIEGNNLEALKLLQTDFAGKIRAIYIDPPYNTANEFVYNDSFRQEDWLSMMYPLLELGRRLLTEDGVIFISIDDNEVDKLRLLLSEIFGRQNFIAQVTIQSNPRGRQAERHFARVHEYVLIFARDASSCRFAGVQLTPDESKEFAYTDTTGRRYRLLGLRQRGADSLREDRPSMYYPIFVNPDDGSVSLDSNGQYQNAVLPRKSTGQDGRWMWSPQRVADNLHRLEARLIRGRNQFDIFVRDFLDDGDGNDRTRKVKTIWNESEINYQNGKRELKDVLGDCPVDYPKPLALLRKILTLVDDPEGVYLDFFAGSGTLGQAVMEKNLDDGGNRRFILVQLPEPVAHPTYETIADICRQRVMRVYDRIKRTPGNRAVGFDYLRIC